MISEPTRPAVARDALSDVQRRIPSGYKFVEGWGMASGVWSRVWKPRDRDELQELLAAIGQTGRQITLRGSGRSYGDASHGADCETIDTTGLDRILAFDEARSEVEVEGGVTIEQLWKYLLPRRHWPAVVPGTMAPTIAGMVSMNVHGKNNWAVGATGAQVRELDLLLADGSLRTLRPGDEALRAVIGGLGLTGIVTRVRLDCKPVHSGNVRVRAISAPNLSAMMADLERFRDDAHYLVGWVDCLARGSHLGRGLSHIAWHLEPGEDPKAERSLEVAYQELPAAILGFPKSEVWRPLRLVNNNAGMRVLNASKHFMGRFEGRRKDVLQSHAAFNFLLDYVPNWKFAYGRKRGTGLIQFQSFVPDERAGEVFTRQLGLCQERGLPSYLGVLKRHRPDDFLLTHVVDGWSLALDFKVCPENRTRLWELCQAMTELVLDAGGRFYGAKDLVLGPGALQRFLPGADLASFRRIRDELDPDRRFQTDLARRLLDPAAQPGLPLVTF
ncbi:MAG: FAD-binding oxidoreductase [Planctomycetota bacterium]